MKKSVIWVTISVVALAIVCFFVWRQIYPKKPAVSQAVANNCDVSAKAYLGQWAESNDSDAQTLLQSVVTPTYTDHFNTSLNGCLIEINGSILRATATGPQSENIIEIDNVSSKAILASMDNYSNKDKNDNVVYSNIKCSFASGGTCNTVSDFNQAAGALMSQ